MMKMRTTKPEQLNLVFATSPQGSQAAEVPDLSGMAKARLHTAKGKEFSGFMTGAVDGNLLLDAVASEFNLRQGAVQSHSEQGSARRGRSACGSCE